MARALLSLVTLLFPLLASAPAEAERLPGKAQWEADVRAAMRGSVGYLDRRTGGGPGAADGRRLAIVLDIDNTSLATEYAWPRPVRPTLRFARHAHTLGVAVVFVTGRYQDTLRSVRPTLRRAGYPVNRMCGRQHGESLTASKQRCRRALVRRGWTVIANVGNRRTDLAGGDYERGFKLPSYGGRLS